MPITEEEFDKLLSLPADDPLRSDFPDSLGDNYQFTYANRNDDVQKQRIKSFATVARKRIENHVTSQSGMLASELAIQPFYLAAYNLYNYSYDPLGALSKWNTAYNATSYAVWSLAGNAGIADSDDLAVVGLGKQILGAASKPEASILKEEPSVTPMLTQNAVFTYKDEDKKWHSSLIKLTADGISTRFSVTVSGTGKAVDSSGNEVTEIKPGDSFSLVSDTEPSGDTEISVSSSVPWMVGDLVVYEPDPNVKTSDDKSFQNMIGVVINHKDLNAVATVRKVDETTSLSFTKQWNDDGNVSGKRPDVSSYAKSLTLLAGEEEQSGYVAEITDNGDNTYTVSYKGLPKLVNGKAVKYSVKEATVEGYTSDSFDVSDGGTLVNTLVVPIPSPTATATVSTPAPTATVTVKENKPVRAVSPAVVKPVPPTGVESSHGENGN
ncbi:MAG: Cna B-type domain-containing protein [Erysipelotrichaceae bacterium]|nr:Cna B-type domain-containing protein [Erysipelotrichaceae bacterium]